MHTLQPSGAACCSPPTVPASSTTARCSPRRLIVLHAVRSRQVRLTIRAVVGRGGSRQPTETPRIRQSWSIRSQALDYRPARLRLDVFAERKRCAIHRRWKPARPHTRASGTWSSCLARVAELYSRAPAWDQLSKKFGTISDMRASIALAPVTAPHPHHASTLTTSPPSPHLHPHHTSTDITSVAVTTTITTASIATRVAAAQQRTGHPCMTIGLKVEPEHRHIQRVEAVSFMP